MTSSPKASDMTVRNSDAELGDPNSQPQHFRKVDFTPRPGRLDLYTRQDGYVGQCMHQGNQSVIIATYIPPKTPGIATHTHPVDQIFLCVEGQITLGVKGTDHTAMAGGLVVIPKGTPHATRNDGDTPTFYLEILAPAPTYFSGLVHEEGISVDRNPTSKVFVVHPQELKEVEMDYATSEPQMLWQHLVSPQMGYQEALIYHAKNPGRNDGQELHFHRFDRFFYVAEGELTVRILFEKYRVPKGTLVVLPGGTPHTQFNERDVPERHFAILTPPFKQGAGEEPPNMWLTVNKLERSH
jgi:quercetin dioxygenase-like cupin family protein